DYLKAQFDTVIIDLPPILGLAETIRLTCAADSIALIIRWGRTERQSVQFALDALRSAGVSASAAILNDVNLKAQHRRGYRDRIAVYRDEGLYRTAPADREPSYGSALATAGAESPRTNSDVVSPEMKLTGESGGRPGVDPPVAPERAATA